MTRDDINKALQEASLGGKYKCKKTSVDGSIDRAMGSETNMIHDENNNPVFDCGWVDWKNRIREFILSQQ